MKRAMRILIGLTLGAALASYLRTEQGRHILTGLMHSTRDLVRQVRATAPAGGGSAEHEEGSLEAKIAETRRRLEAQLRAGLGGGGPA
ncbi:MAG: hypothetical protein M5U22_15275 [Thermoleophilia bacterium]|nr:hypothetical protein [Thermoleophilia bacterium]